MSQEVGYLKEAMWNQRTIKSNWRLICSIFLMRLPFFFAIFIYVIDFIDYVIVVNGVDLALS